MLTVRLWSGVQTGLLKLVQTCNVNPAPLVGGEVNAAAFVGHVKVTFPEEEVMVGCGGAGSAILNTVP